jgi:hypothetical protein
LLARMPRPLIVALLSCLRWTGLPSPLQTSPTSRQTSDAGIFSDAEILRHSLLCVAAISSTRIRVLAGATTFKILFCIFCGRCSHTAHS